MAVKITTETSKLVLRLSAETGVGKKELEVLGSPTPFGSISQMLVSTLRALKPVRLVFFCDVCGLCMSMILMKTVLATDADAVRARCQRASL